MRSALWPFKKQEDKDKATATVMVVVVAVEVVVVGKLKAKDNGIGEGKSKRTTLKRPSFFAIVCCANCGTKHNVREKAWQESLDPRKEDQRNTKKGQGKGGKDQAKGGSKGEEKGNGGKANGGKANEGKGGKGRGDDKGKPPAKKRLKELSEGEREKKRKRVLKLERQAKNLKDLLAGDT